MFTEKKKRITKSSVSILPVIFICYYSSVADINKGNR